VPLLPLLLTACSAFAPLTKPEGGGGWSEARRRLLPTTTATGRYAWYTDPRTTGVDRTGIPLPPGTPPPGGGRTVMRPSEEPCIDA
jgi:hypothetical protein